MGSLALCAHRAGRGRGNHPIPTAGKKREQTVTRMSLPLLSTVQSSWANMSDATVLLAAVEQGDPKAADKLLDLVYEELRRLAAYKMAHEAPGQTLQPTALVHEAWLKLIGAG